MRMSKPKRLHPISAIINLLKQLKELIVPFIVFVVLGSKGTKWDYFYLVASVVTVVYVLIVGIISWLRYTYRMEDGELRIEYGVFVRKKRYIPFEKIQSLDWSEGILHRPLGLVKVKIETAGANIANGAEAELTAITKSEAKAIEDMLMSLKKSELPDNPYENSQQAIPDELVYKITMKELLLLSITSGGAGVVLSAIVAFVFQFDDLIPYERVFKSLKELVANGLIFITMLIFIVFLLAWIISLIGTMLKFANFTVKKVGKDIVIQRGLLEKRQLTIPLNRIQAIRISENLIRQPLGYGTAYLESAGGSEKDMDSAKVMVLPIMKKKKMATCLKSYFPEINFEPNIQQVPKRALRRYVLKGWMLVVPMVVAAIIFSRPWGYLSLVLFPITALWQYMEFQTAGWAVNGNQLTLRYRTISKNTVFMKKNKIQSLNIKESYFQRKKDLITIQSAIKSGSGVSGGSVIDLEREDGLKIYQWYSNHFHNRMTSPPE